MVAVVGQTLADKPYYYYRPSNYRPVERRSAECEQKSTLPSMAKMVTAAGIGGALLRVSDVQKGVDAMPWIFGWSTMCGLCTWAKFKAQEKNYKNHPELLTCLTTSLGACVAGRYYPEIKDYLVALVKTAPAAT